MKNRMKFVYLALAVICCLASYRLGIYLTFEAMKSGHTDVQAMLAFNHSKSFSEIKQCLDNGVIEGARQRVENSLISERNLLAGKLSTGVSPYMLEYIELRSEVGIDELKAYESDRGSSWSLTSCE